MGAIGLRSSRDSLGAKSVRWPVFILTMTMFTGAFFIGLYDVSIVLWAVLMIGGVISLGWIYRPPSAPMMQQSPGPEATGRRSTGKRTPRVTA